MSEILVELGKLTQASQAQTAASEAQTAEVAGKMAEINSELAKALTMVSGLTRTFFVDAHEGSDNNSGQGIAPFKTLSKAISSVPTEGRADIYIKPNQTHVVDAPIGVNGAFVTVRAWEWSGIVSELPLIMFSSTQNENHNYLQFLSLSGGPKIRFFQVSLDHEDKKDPSLPWSNQGSICYTSDTGGMDPVVCLNRCNVNLRSGSRLFLSSISGGTLLSYNTSFTGEGQAMYTNTVGMAGYLTTTFEDGVLPFSGKVFSNIEVI